jgi:hypothetical protein
MRCLFSHAMLASILGVAFMSEIAAPRTARATAVPTVIFSENFNAGLPGGGFLTGGSGTVTGVAGTAQLANSGGNLTYYTSTTFSGEQFTFLGDVEQLNGALGGTANGILVGNRAYVFFGGFPGGAFNILGINPATAAVTGTVLGDTNMGYTPLQGDRQHFEIEVVPVLSTFNITIEITNLDGPGSFTHNYIDGGFVPGSVGFFNWSQPHTTQFDNLQVIALVEVPEPSTLALLGIGGIGLAIRMRRRGGGKIA